MESCVFVSEDFPKENRMQANKKLTLVKLKIVIFYIQCCVTYFLIQIIMTEKEFNTNYLNIAKSLEGQSLKDCIFILEQSIKIFENIAKNHTLKLYRTDKELDEWIKNSFDSKHPEYH